MGVEGNRVVDSGQSIPTVDSLLAGQGEGETQAPFRGSFSHQLDSKGRINIPMGYRSLIEEMGSADLVVTNYICDGSRCLEAFPLATWRTFERRISKLSRFDARLKTLENYYLSRASMCSLDTSGRILLPAHLRDYAGLKSEVTFTSGLRGFRIWNSTVWTHVFENAEAALLENPDLFSGIDLAGLISEEGS